MFWNLLIVLAVLVILVIFARRLPDARRRIKESKEDTSEKISLYGIIAQADTAFDEKDYPKAEELYVKAAMNEPNNAKIYSRLGAIYLEQKNYYDAKDAFMQAAKLEPDLSARRINLGLAYMGLKDYFKAKDEFKKASELDPKNKKYRQLLEKAVKLQDREKKRK